MDKVAITGLGVISSLGNTIKEFNAGLDEARVTAEQVEWAEDYGQPHVYRTKVHDFDALEWMDERVANGTDGFAQYAIAAAVQAVRDAGLEEGLDPLRTAVIVGTSMAGARTLADAQKALDDDGYDAVPRKLQLMAWPNMAGGHIALRYQLHGPLLTVSTACASSLDAIGLAAQMIETGQVDVAIAGGTDYGDVPVSAMGAVRYGMMPSDIDDPTMVCRPFDANRRGIVSGEGAGMVVLESVEQAKARGAAIHGMVRGYASLADSYHPSSPEPSGKWEKLAMSNALKSAGLEPTDVQAVVAHATGTPVGDTAEIQAINELFVDAGADVYAMGIKGHVGHTAGAAGVMGMFAALHSIEQQAVIPVASTTDLEPSIRFRVPLREPATHELRNVQVNAFGFAGQNASLVVSGAG